MKPTTIRPAVLEDAAALAPNLRQADRDEIAAITPVDPEVALRYDIEKSDTVYAAVDAEGSVLCLFGAGHAPGDPPFMGRVWMLASDKILDHRWEFLRRSREELHKLFAHYQLLYNFVDARNTLHVRWLRWLGFTFIAKHENHGIESRTFYEFVQCASESPPQRQRH